jgi:DNA-binding PadR family transcriptional regulator
MDQGGPRAAQRTASGGPPRRYYAITAQGRQALTDELRKMAAVVRFAKSRDLLRGESVG